MRTVLMISVALILATAVHAQRAQPRQQGQAQQEQPVLDPRMGVPGARFPALSPDGKTVVFTLHGNLWTMPATGGRATRLTFQESFDTRPLISPDGQSIVFVSDRAGSHDIYVMPIDGGPARRLTHHNATDVPTGFTKDGRNVIFQSSRDMGWSRISPFETYSIPLAGGTPTRLTFTGAHSATTPDDGATLYFIAGASDAKVAEYEGTANDRLFIQRRGEPPVEILSYRGNSREPSVSRDGQRLHFTREVNGSFELFFCGTENPEVCVQMTSLGHGGLSNVSFAPDDSSIVFVWRYYLWSLDLNTENAKPRQLRVEIREDMPEEVKVERRFTAGVSRAHLSRDGNRIVFSLGGDLWHVGANGGNATQITNDIHANENPQLSPDGRTVSFYSNRSGTSDIWLIDINGQNLRQFTSNAGENFFQSWSPDGQSIVFCSTRTGTKHIWLQRLDGSAAQQLTSGNHGNDDPSFSPDGNQIVFDSNRSNPNGADIWIMDVDGGNQRRVFGTQAIEEVPMFTPDGRFILFNRVTRGPGFVRQEVVMTDLAGSGEATVALGAIAGVSPDGKDTLYVDPQGQLNYVPTPTGLFAGRNVPFTAVREVSLRDEMLKAFDEAHESFKAAFYDPEFHGKDWDALGRHYRALVATVKTREEFLFYLNRMVGQVSASHTGASGSGFRVQREATGIVGMELVPEALPQNRMRLRVAEIDRGGPADRAWIRTGDYIFRINRQPLSIRNNIHEFFDGKTGQEVSLFVADNPEGRNQREVMITPESFGQRRQRHYQQYVIGNKQTAAQRSRGAIGYIHLPGMMPNNFTAFQNELATPQIQATRALIIDVRDNGGGNIHQQLIDLLSRKPYAYMTLRDGRRINQPTVYWDRPIVILINERSYSDAEVFPHAMKVLDMATVIGVPTPGAVIGTRNIRLSDGTSWRLPSTGFYNWDGTNQERNGCEPHIHVEVTPADVLAGRDPQMDKAIEVLLEQLRSPRTPSTEEPKPEPRPEEPAREGEFLEPPALPWDEQFDPANPAWMN